MSPEFSLADEVLWVHTKWTVQAEFPCYLYDFFPKVNKLRLNSGGMEFRNAPLPVTVIERFIQLELLELQFIGEYIPGVFRHLPMHSLPQLLISDAEEDGVYAALELLRSPFHLSIYATSGAEDVITVEGQKPKLVRHLLEAHKYYEPGSQPHKCALGERGIRRSARDVKDPHISLEYAASVAAVVHLITEAHCRDRRVYIETSHSSAGGSSLPRTAHTCYPGEADFVYIAAEEVCDFVDRITAQAVRLELCRMIVGGSLDLLATRFNPVVRIEDRLGLRNIL